MSDIVKRIAGIINDHEKAIFDHSNGSFQCALVIIGVVNEQYTRTDTIPQWQPIETAPKDGRNILIISGFSPNSRAVEGYWRTETTENNITFLQGWVWVGDDSVPKPYMDPQGWMPLPTPPKETT